MKINNLFIRSFLVSVIARSRRRWTEAISSALNKNEIATPPEADRNDKTGFLSNLKIPILILFILPFVFVSAYNFKQKVYLPRGMMWTHGLLCGYDTNHNGYNEVIFCVGRPDTFYKKTHIWECQPINRFILSSIVGDSGFYNGEVGHADNDSFSDIVGFNADGTINYQIGIYESPDYCSYPKLLSWKWDCSVQATFSDMHIAELDDDFKKEIVFTAGGRFFFILENCGNNRYSLVWCDTVTTNADAHCFGDFDLDGRGEFVTSGISSHWENVQVFECIGDNQYQRVWCDTIPTPNCLDNISTNDLDRDGKSEFIIMNFYNPGNMTWTGCVRIYETIGNNLYDISYQDSILDIRTWPDWYTSSSSGDVDADGVDELVWAVANNWLIYKARGNNQFERIYTVYPWPQGNSHNATNVLVYDLNKNGYGEIVESGGNETHIFEICGAEFTRPDSGQIFIAGSQEWIRWRKFDPPGADSFTLFISFDNGRNYQTITTIQQSNDTSYLWSVPDTVSDSCRLMIWSYGPPRAGQNTPRGIAWDFSGRFAIKRVEVKEDRRWQIADGGIKILQNPTRREIRLQITDVSQKQIKIYDISGKLVKSLTLYTLPSAFSLKSGVYFLRLETENKVITKKVVVVD